MKQFSTSNGNCKNLFATLTLSYTLSRNFPDRYHSLYKRQIKTALVKWLGSYGLYNPILVTPIHPPFNVKPLARRSLFLPDFCEFSQDTMKEPITLLEEASSVCDCYPAEWSEACVTLMTFTKRHKDTSHYAPTPLAFWIEGERHEPWAIEAHSNPGSHLHQTLCWNCACMAQSGLHVTT